MIRRFRKKAVIIEARQVGLDPMEDEAFKRWCRGRSPSLPGVVFVIDGESTSEVHEVRIGSWVIQGSRGEFYVCSRELFDKIYEPAYAGEESA